MKNSDSVGGSYEFERLVARTDGIEEENGNFTLDDDDDDDEDSIIDQLMVDNGYVFCLLWKRDAHLWMNSSRTFQGNVARAVSLCLFNKIHSAQIYWPETVGSRRVSISQPEYTEDFCLQSTVISGSTEFEHDYDGLSNLDVNRLEQMRETDLIY